MDKIFLTVIFLLLCDSCVYSSNMRESLKLTINSDKEVYQVGEKINLTASIGNQSKDLVKIYSPAYWGVSELIIKNSKGLVMSPKGLKIKRGPFESFMFIPSHGIQKYTYENLRWFHCGGAWQFIDGAKLPQDSYTIAVSITNPPQTQRCAEFYNYEPTNLLGTLNSNTIVIKVQGKNKKKLKSLDNLQPFITSYVHPRIAAIKEGLIKDEMTLKQIVDALGRAWVSPDEGVGVLRYFFDDGRVLNVLPHRYDLSNAYKIKLDIRFGEGKMWWTKFEEQKNE